jgi:membrane protease YdiL (CAAX protease family)
MIFEHNLILYMEKRKEIKKLGFLGSFVIYIPATILMYCLTKYFIPYLCLITGQEPIIFWFIVGGVGIFTPLIITGLLILKSEGYRITKNTWIERLRFREITRKDVIWSLIGLVSVGILSFAAMNVLELLIGKYDYSPEFMSFEPLTKGRYWLLLIWLPYWILNILGEEFLWRGVMLPRQEVAFGKYTWLIHGFGWGLFHIAFGWQLLITLLPLIFIQSYVIQKTKNSWIGVFMHGAINGPSFVAICFGLI